MLWALMICKLHMIGSELLMNKLKNQKIHLASLKYKEQPQLKQQQLLLVKNQSQVNKMNQ